MPVGIGIIAMIKKPSWNQKLEASKPHKVKRLGKNFAGMKAGQMMLVPSPKLLDEFIQTISAGSNESVISLREQLAKKHKADVTCPVATGFAIKIVAEAAYEKLNQGDDPSDVTPVWRVLDKESPTLTKVSFDGSIFLNLRESELSNM